MRRGGAEVEAARKGGCGTGRRLERRRVQFSLLLNRIRLPATFVDPNPFLP